MTFNLLVANFWTSSRVSYRSIQSPPSTALVVTLLTGVDLPLAIRVLRVELQYASVPSTPLCSARGEALLNSLLRSNIPEYTLSSLCTLHTGGSDGVQAADGAGPPPCHLSSPSRDTTPGLGCSATGSGTQKGTIHTTGQRGRPGRTCSQSRSPSGKAQGKGRIFPARQSKKGKDSSWNYLTPTRVESRRALLF